MREPDWPLRDRPPHTVVWELWKIDRIMSCKVNEHPLGREIRCYLRGDFHYSHVSKKRELPRTRPR